MKVRNDLQVGMQVYVVAGVLTAEPFAPVFVTKGRIEKLRRPDGLTDIVSLGELGIHSMGMTAFINRESAYLAASIAQGYNLLEMTGVSADHVLALNKLIEKVKPRMPNDWHTPNFSWWEFLCPDCKRQRMNQRFIIRLQIARMIAGIPFVPGSGWRCKKRNAAVGGVEDSSHLPGLAADIMALTSKERFIILDALLRAGFTRIGIAKYYIHVDSDLSKPQGVLWQY